MVPSTKSELIAQTVTWFPHNLKIPSADAKQTIFAAAKYLTQDLLQTESTPLIPPEDTNTRKALQQISDIFRNQLTTYEVIPPSKPNKFPKGQ